VNLRAIDKIGDTSTEEKGWFSIFEIDHLSIVP
jgi:hypothetical protein